MITYMKQYHILFHCFFLFSFYLQFFSLPVSFFCGGSSGGFAVKKNIKSWGKGGCRISGATTRSELVATTIFTQHLPLRQPWYWPAPPSSLGQLQVDRFVRPFSSCQASRASSRNPLRASIMSSRQQGS